MRFSLKSYALAVLALSVAGAASAQEIAFYYATQGTTNKLDTKTITVGQDFFLTVVLLNRSGQDLIYNSGNVLMGLGTTTTQGTAAVADAGSMKVGINGTAANSATFPYPPQQGSLTRDLRGGRGSNGPTRPYGYNVPIDLPLGTNNTVVDGSMTMLFDVHLKNVSLAAGQHQHIFIFNAGSGSSGTSVMLNGGTAHRQGSAWAAETDLDLSVAPVPEPTSVIALLAGIGALVARRRRKA